MAIDTWEPTGYLPLLASMAADLRHDLYTEVDEADAIELDRWQRLGFRVARRELRVELPTDPRRTQLDLAPTPPGIVLLGADSVDEDRLRLLDEELRSDVPGSTAWVNDPVEFREYTFDERSFDPATYLVAVDDAAECFAGLSRVWLRPRPRLGLVGVTRPYRRRGLGRAMLAAVLGVVHERGIATVAAEVDESNTASMALLTGIGGQSVGATLELRRPADS